MWTSGWGRRGIQGRGNSGDKGPAVGVHTKSSGKSKEAREARAVIKVR